MSAVDLSMPMLRVPPHVPPAERAIADTRDPRDVQIENADQMRQEIARHRDREAKDRVYVAALVSERDSLAHELHKMRREVTMPVWDAVIASIPATIADVLVGAKYIDAAMERALDDAVARCETAGRERDDALHVCRVEAASRQEIQRLLGVARAEVARLTAHLDPATVQPPKAEAAPVAAPERPPAPDLRPGDRVSVAGRVFIVTNLPRRVDGAWGVEACRADEQAWKEMLYAPALDLSTRVRTWRAGEVVPQAPSLVPRRAADGSMLTGGAYPLAEDWTQTGV